MAAFNELVLGLFLFGNGDRIRDLGRFTADGHPAEDRIVDVEAAIKLGGESGVGGKEESLTGLRPVLTKFIK